MSGFVAPRKPLPFDSSHRDVDAYVDALLSFVTESETLSILCGRVHILDFLTETPDVYASILPPAWREWLANVPISDLLDLLLREDLAPLRGPAVVADHSSRWREHPAPPESFLDYIQTVRSLCLDRSFKPSRDVSPAKLTRDMRVGMKPKKAHEVVNFAAFVDDLISEVNHSTAHRVTRVVDFGSGRNYLGRVLASPPYQRRIIAVESKHLNISGAKHIDVWAKFVEKDTIWRNKKEFRATGINTDTAQQLQRERESAIPPTDTGASYECEDPKDRSIKNPDDRIQYVEHSITTGDLRDVFVRPTGGDALPEAEGKPCASPIPSSEAHHDRQIIDELPEMMVVSLHSCGNLLHHGLRSLVLNPFVKVVAMIGCCYNLTTERLGPPTVKHPSLRAYSQRVDDCASAYDPHGFPMSDRLGNYSHQREKGIRMNITARMMAGQAPQNWTKSESDLFFTRHFYRALFQRMLVDKGLVAPVEREHSQHPQEKEQCLTLGALRKHCYESFATYVRGAIERLDTMPAHKEKANVLRKEISDETIQSYWQRYMHKKHDLCIVWSLMAFSAGVVESLIVTDRWLFLREQDCVSQTWVQTVFDYGLSPRNLVVVGIKK